MIKASNRFKAKLKSVLLDTDRALDLPSLSQIERHYYKDVCELLHDLEAVIYLDNESVEFNLQTIEEIYEAKEKVKKVR